MDAIIGGVLGGLARLAPEVLKALDRKNERAHELKMSQHQLEVIKIQGHQKIESDQLALDSAQVVAGVGAIQAAYQSMKTGFKLADTISALVRPWVTFMIVHVWLLVKLAAYITMIKSGISWDVAIQTLWTDDDKAMLAGVLNFWFLGRVFEKRGK
jgi:hypothetical protein